MNLKASMNAVHRDVSTYVSELEQRISQLEQTASQIESSTSTVADISSISNAKKQLDEIKAAAGIWQSGKLEKDANDLEKQIDAFLNTQLPAAVQPFSKTLADWKTRFNVAMTNAGQKYQELNEALKIDTTDLQKASKTFSSQKRALANLAREIESVPSACEAMVLDIQELIEEQKRELSVSLSSLSQQLQLDIMRAKATTNSTLSQSLSNCQTSSFNNFFNTLQTDVNAQCAQMEQNVKEVHAMLDASEKQWENDVAQMKDDIKNELASMQHSVGTGFALQQKIKEANQKVKELDKMISEL
ncbi:hypothetical protein TRFO_35549 [Tritrichomonas foetus]|uniref:Uncharacterized protein n=1 Tax=Tritrichomonas foetus TaxID=1144522 RepID=A0A1J4JFT9_9EUKA|nr:hypothetical protein TRFO_35549 [Tritrichomonas foetus]|eukprot:OHS98086.1 hypothetical protein TRFO_35549 [Tritrichomonas foetus]